MKVLITGATGFIGLNIVESLIEAGHSVRAYVRSSSNTKHLNSFPVTLFEGELADTKTLTEAMRNCDAVIHTAGNTSCFSRDYKMLYNVNVLGTRSVVEAAIVSGVSRLVYTSTTSTIGAKNSKNDSADEQQRISGFRARSAYARTKALAEDVVLRARRHGVEVIILNPAEVIGAYDHNFQWGRMVMAVFSDQVPFIPPGGGSFCSAKAVGRAHVAALTRGDSGKRYILADEHYDYRTFLDSIVKLLGKNYTKPDINYFRLYWKEKLKDILYPLLGKEFMVEPYRIRVFGGHYYFSSERAKQELGYTPDKLEVMLEECINWYRKTGILPN